MRNNRFLITVLLLCATMSVVAQHDRLAPYSSSGYTIPGSSAVNFAAPTTAPTTLTQPSLKIEEQPSNVHERPTKKKDAQSQTSTPTDTIYYGPEAELPAQDNFYVYPAPLWAYYNYGGLHQGLNMSLGMSVFAAFGKNAPKGAGFSQNLSATWLQPLGKHAWLAAGGYINHVNWSGNSYTSGGLHGELGYQFNEHWAGYIYGQKNIINNGLQAYGYPYGRGIYNYSPFLYNELGNKLGAAIRWTPNPTMSVEVSVEKNWYPNANWGYPDRYKYKYPVPQN
ncbi:MAG: hypothetical protein ACOYJK_09165 [Prevotella sp.]|jgi:hypothetical protein